MTDADKLALLDESEEIAWEAFKRSHTSANLETIERCQRIRVNLKGSVIPFPVGKDLLNTPMGTAPISTIITSWDTTFEPRVEVRIQCWASLEPLGFIPRTCNALTRAGIDKDSLFRMTNDALLKVNHIGEKSLYEIRQKVATPEG